MDVLVQRSAGLDVHRSIIVACVVLSLAGGRVVKHREQFSATASGLAKLAAWLKGHEVTHVGMESTGVYWMPVYAVLEAEARFDLIVANAQHVKQVPGRKTDVGDAEWLARLVRCGLMRKELRAAEADPRFARLDALSPHLGRDAGLGAPPPDQAVGGHRYQACGRW